MTLTTQRRRYILRHEAGVSCPAGRWGRRRLRVSECWAKLTAEDCYTALLKDGGGPVVPGAMGTLTVTFGTRPYTASWQLRHNGVWRCGRVFLMCPQCNARCTRLYVPTSVSWLACRSCWGLTYSSRTLQNYKDSMYGRGQFARILWSSQREWAFLATHEKRKERLNRSRQRWAERRAIRKWVRAREVPMRKRRPK